MIFASGAELGEAKDSAVRFASEGGWTFVDVKRGTQINDPEVIEDEMLRDTAEEALETGCALVVYTDEKPADS